MNGTSPVFFLVMGLIVSVIAGTMNQDVELFFILMGLFGFFAFMMFMQEKKDLKEENRNLRWTLDNSHFYLLEEKKKEKRKKNNQL